MMTKELKTYITVQFKEGRSVRFLAEKYGIHESEVEQIIREYMELI